MTARSHQRPCGASIEGARIQRFCYRGRPSGMAESRSTGRDCSKQRSRTFAHLQSVAGARARSFSNHPWGLLPDHVLEMESNRRFDDLPRSTEVKGNLLNRGDRNVADRSLAVTGSACLNGGNRCRICPVQRSGLVTKTRAGGHLEQRVVSIVRVCGH